MNPCQLNSMPKKSKSSTTQAADQAEEHVLVHTNSPGIPLPRRNKSRSADGKDRKSKLGYNAKRLVNDEKGDVKEAMVLELFVREYLSNGGNATLAARRLFPEQTLMSAVTTAGHLMTEARRAGLFRTMIEKKGYSLDQLIEVAIEKMHDGAKPDWWDRLMRMSGYEDFTAGGRTAVTVNTNIFEAHRGLKSTYVEAEVVEEPDTDED
jgi:hypothetical protein